MKYKVIIVEDVKLELKGTEEIFRHEIPDAEVIGTAMTEQEFWPLMEKELPDLVLLDLGLGGSTTIGVDICRNIFRKYPGVHVLIFTGEILNEKLWVDVLDAGADGIILKTGELLTKTDVQAVKDGKIRHFFLVGGCDGTRPSRRYYTEFAKLTPQDTVILTLACGKFRLNDLPLGNVPGTGLPRILDVGQCNDAYSAIRIALALADAFGCGVNDLPLSLVLCWFEQKAVCILIALLALGIKNIRLGPTLPAFLSPGVVQVLQQKYDLKAVTTPEDDLHAILGG